MPGRVIRVRCCWTDLRNRPSPGRPVDVEPGQGHRQGPRRRQGAGVPGEIARRRQSVEELIGGLDELTGVLGSRCRFRRRDRGSLRAAPGRWRVADGAPSTTAGPWTDRRVSCSDGDRREPIGASAATTQSRGHGSWPVLRSVPPGPVLHVRTRFRSDWIAIAPQTSGYFPYGASPVPSADGELVAGADAELAVHAGEVGVDGARRQVEDVGDLAAAAPAGRRAGPPRARGPSAARPPAPRASGGVRTPPAASPARPIVAARRWPGARHLRRWSSSPNSAAASAASASTSSAS